MIDIFENTINILKDSLESINENQYYKLVDECEKTLVSGNKVVVSGLGKNVPICDKFVGSMISMGLNANFLHTNSAVHGDMGMVRPGDLVIILTKSGATAESVYLAELLKERENINLWLLSFKPKSKLTEIIGSGNSLIVDLEHEGDLWNIMPNNSTTLNLIILQSIAMQLAGRMGLTLEKNFKPNHPGGAIGVFLKNEK